MKSRRWNTNPLSIQNNHVSASNLPMPLSAEHTATPWDFANSRVTGQYGERIADCVNRDHAAFIVRACNNHDALLAALRDAERELNISVQTQPQASIALRTVRAAIAQAEGK